MGHHIVFRDTWFFVDAFEATVKELPDYFA
jgi:hypothetical protein